MYFSDIGDGRNILEDSMMIIQNTGMVQWNPPLTLNAWCEVEDLGVWPRDKHECTLILGVKKHFSDISIEFVRNESTLVNTINLKTQFLDKRNCCFVYCVSLFIF